MKNESWPLDLTIHGSLTFTRVVSGCVGEGEGSLVGDGVPHGNGVHWGTHLREG